MYIEVGYSVIESIMSSTFACLKSSTEIHHTFSHATHVIGLRMVTGIMHLGAARLTHSGIMIERHYAFFNLSVIVVSIH